MREYFSYIEVLKAENKTDLYPTKEAKEPSKDKVPEMERTIFVLKRLVEKLQAENKRLSRGSSTCTVVGRTASEEKLRNDLKSVKQQLSESLTKIRELESELAASREKIHLVENRPVPNSLSSLANQLAEVKGELAQKSQLLDKVKVLLHRAASKEKALLDEVGI